jgi:peroxiredoxin
MDFYLILVLGLTWVAIVVVSWLGWQLLRQNGRLLLRLEALEAQLNELEFGEDEDPANRFNNGSLAKSKITRDGLKAGTPAPDFRLPRLDGRGELSLSDFRGRRVLLVFSSPQCGPCNALAPELEKFYQSHHYDTGQRREVEDSSMFVPVNPSPQPSPPNKLVLPMGEGESAASSGASVEVVMISKGEPKENRAKVKEHGLTFPIVLQQQWEISRRYAMFVTPIAYLINEQGIIIQDVAVGTDAIQSLLTSDLAAAIPDQLLVTNH